MTKKKPIVCTITKQKRSASDQPFTVSIAEPGKTEYNLKPRYTNRTSARRGAIRNQGAFPNGRLPNGNWQWAKVLGGQIVLIEFIYVDKSKPARKGE